jgi:hypothetical protein
MTIPPRHTLKCSLEVVKVDGTVGFFSQASGDGLNEAVKQASVDRVEWQTVYLLFVGGFLLFAFNRASD